MSQGENVNRYTAGPLAACYVATIVLANWLSTRYGLVPAGFGLVVSAGTYSAALALGLRDWLQDAAGVRWVFAAIAVGALVSWGVGSGRIALASGIAFALSETADLLVYTPLREARRRFAIAASNAVGAVVDTLLFLSISGFGVTAQSFGGQLLVKAVWVTGGFLLLDLAVRHAVSLRRVEA